MWSPVSSRAGQEARDDALREAAPDCASSWYPDAVVYALNVKTFLASRDDGIGGLRGLQARLDCQHDLGVACVLLEPLMAEAPSPGGVVDWLQLDLGERGRTT
jgi:hypothetical protein